jgi:hypothetical protein
MFIPTDGRNHGHPDQYEMSLTLLSLLHLYHIVRDGVEDADTTCAVVLVVPRGSRLSTSDIVKLC